MTNTDRKELALWATEYAKLQGASDAVVVIGNSRDVEVEVRDQKVETIKESTTNNLSLEIYSQGKHSGHSTNNLRKEDLKRFISEAVSATLYLASDPYRLLTDSSLYPTSEGVDLQLFDAAVDTVTPENRLEIALEIEAIARAKSDRIITASAGFTDGTMESVRVHSNGFVGERTTTAFAVGGSVTIKDGEFRPNGDKWASTRFFSELPSAKELGEEAVDKALKKIGQKKIASGKYDMIVENSVAGRLLFQLIGPMMGRNLQQKSSFLDGKIGEQIASEQLTITDNPFLAKAFGSKHFDSDGIATRKRVMIEKGVLKGYYIDNYYGRKLEMNPTGGSISNLTFEQGSLGLNEMIASTKKGIVVSSINGGNSNATSGDFSFGVSGFYVENGIVVQAINEMNVTGNAQEFWKKLSLVGNDAYTYSSILSPTLMFEGIDFSGL